MEIAKLVARWGVVVLGLVVVLTSRGVNPGPLVSGSMVRSSQGVWSVNDGSFIATAGVVEILPGIRVV